MAIRVTCPKCMKRFDVSDKFAGQTGPCPKCKTKITIPKKSEEIVIAEPTIGPKDSKGRSILKPIGRKETKLTSVDIAVIACSLIGYLVCALIMNFVVEDKSTFPMPILWLSAFLIAPPICYAAYTFLRNQELGAFLGKELWIRILICGLVYALLWIAMPLAKFAFNDSYQLGSWITALIAMIGLGAGTAMLGLDLDYLTGLLHYGMYLGFCIVGRLLAGIGVLPGSVGAPEVDPKPIDNVVDPLDSLMYMSQPLYDCVAVLLGA